MEEYLQYMKTLRSQMNDVEDQAAKISVEEQMQLTSIQTMEKDLDSAKSETKKLKEDTDQMMKAKGQICSRILEKQRRIASLESDSSTLTQTLELIQQERDSLSAKLLERRTFYTKVGEELSAKLQEQQEWVNFHKSSRELGEHGLIKDRINEQTGETEGKSSIDGDLIMDNLMKQYLEQLKCRENDFKPELRAMDIKTLQEEHNALLSDKDGETEYLQSLLDQIESLKGISHVIKCACGKEYKVGVDCCV
ncbi:coiled-coil domain-containing protein 158 [Fagus crenata]